MRDRPGTAQIRRASGLPHPDALRLPERTGRIHALAARLPESAALPGLVRLFATVAATGAAQLSLLAEQQSALVARAGELCTTTGGRLEDSLCTVTVLSGDVLVAADAPSHPWLHDLLPVRDGQVGRYLGVPLALADGTPLGALCAFDPFPGPWSQEHVTRACEVADLVAAELQRLEALSSPASSGRAAPGETCPP